MLAAMKLYYIVWLALALTPVPPTISSVDTAMGDLGLWPIVSFFVIIAAVIYLYRRFARR